MIPAVTHVDGSGRLQTVSKRTNPLYHAVIARFLQKTGVVGCNNEIKLRSRMELRLGFPDT